MRSDKEAGGTVNGLKVFFAQSVDFPQPHARVSSNEGYITSRKVSSGTDGLCHDAEASKASSFVV
ncbi:MAG: hypothetical protein ABF416_06200 [Zymomonas mobilis subsp. pomaceae]